jgi:hypothetical protein
MLDLQQVETHALVGRIREGSREGDLDLADNGEDPVPQALVHPVDHRRRLAAVRKEDPTSARSAP